MSDAANSKKQRGRPFKKGESGNPSGRPTEYHAFRQECRDFTPELLAWLKSQVVNQCEDAAFSVKLLLEYGYGKPSSAPEDVEAAQALIVQIVKLGRGDGDE